MKAWLTAKEIAAAMLHGIPSSERRVRSFAQRGAWQYRARARGKGLEYHISSLPEAAQIQLMAGQAPELKPEPAPTGLVDGMQKWAGIRCDATRARARARKWVVSTLERLAVEEGSSPTAVARTFEHRLLSGEIEGLAEHFEHLPRRRGVPSLSQATLLRWLKADRQAGLGGLVDEYGTRAGHGTISDQPELMRTVLGCLIQRPHIQPRAVHAYLVADKPHLPSVSEATIRRFFQRWKAENAQLWTYISHPDKWKSVYMAAHGSQSESVTALNGLWEMDATPADWMLKDGRHALILVIDIFSRRMRGIVSKTSKALAVGLTFRRAVLDWGVPTKLRHDNGREFVGQLMGDLLRAIEVEQEICIPFASEQKGHVERGIQTLLHGLLELLPGFLGHNVTERQAIESRKSFASRVMTEGEVIEAELTAADLQDAIDRWCDAIYQHNAHSGLGGRTPFEVAAAWRGPVRRLSNPEALDVLLLEPAGTRTVTKKGVRFEHRDYIDIALTERVGEAVRIRVDPADLGRILVFSDAGEYICWARSDLSGVSRQEAAAAAKHHQRKFVAEQKRELVAYQSEVKRDMVGAVMAYREERTRSLAALPSPSIEHVTPGLEIAAEALTGLQPWVEPELTEAQQADLKVIEVEFSAPQQRQRIDTLRSDPERDEHWHALDAELRAGRQLSEDERRFHTAWQRSDYFATARDMEIEFQAKQA